METHIFGKRIQWSYEKRQSGTAQGKLPKLERKAEEEDLIAESQR